MELRDYQPAALDGKRGGEAAQRVRTPCVENPVLRSQVLEAGVKDLVLNVHGHYSIHCLASCQGHGRVRWLRREPYLYFHSEPQVAEWVDAFVWALGDRRFLSRRWHVTGIMHPDLGLSFLLTPLELGPRVGGLNKDRRDLGILAVILDKALERVTEMPPGNQSDYRQKKQYAENLIPVLVEGVRIPAPRTWRVFVDTCAQRGSAFFARFRGHGVIPDAAD